MTDFTDEQLTAYLDDQLDLATSRDIEAALARDGHLSRRLSELHVDRDAISSAFDALMTQAPAPPEAADTAPTSWNFAKSLALMAAVVLALALGWWGGQRRGALDDWTDYAAAYHRLYVDETLGQIAFDERVLQNQLVASGVSWSVASLSGFDELTLKRSQPLGFEGNLIAHIAFQDDRGNPVALCITKADEETTLQFSERLGMQTAYWTKNGQAYFLIGGDDASLVQRAARHFAPLG